MKRLFLALSLVLLAAPVLAQAQPSGLYLFTRVWSGSLEIDGFLFDGNSVVRSPVGQGGDDAPAEDRGTVAVNGGTMTIAWGDGSNDEGSFSPDASGCFSYDGGLFCPAKRYAGETLDGTFSGGASIPGAISSFTVTFNGDGTFRSNGLSQFFVGDGSTGSTSEDTGRYSIGDTAITFSGVNSETWSVTSFPYHDDYEGGENPNRIYLGGLILTRQ